MLRSPPAAPGPPGGRLRGPLRVSPPPLRVPFACPPPPCPSVAACWRCLGAGVSVLGPPSPGAPLWAFARVVLLVVVSAPSPPSLGGPGRLRLRGVLAAARLGRGPPRVGGRRGPPARPALRRPCRPGLLAGPGAAWRGVAPVAARLALAVPRPFGPWAPPLPRPFAAGPGVARAALGLLRPAGRALRPPARRCRAAPLRGGLGALYGALCNEGEKRVLPRTGKTGQAQSLHPGHMSGLLLPKLNKTCTILFNFPFFDASKERGCRRPMTTATPPFGQMLLHPYGSSSSARARPAHSPNSSAAMSASLRVLPVLPTSKISIPLERC